MAQLSVITVQQGLHVFSQRTGTPSPGAIDGAWGPRTAAAYEPFVARIAPEHGLDAAVVVSQLAGVATGARLVVVPAALAETLDTLSRQYSAPARPPAVPTAPSVPGPSPRGSNATMTIVGVGIGAAVFGGLAWWFLRQD